MLNILQYLFNSSPYLNLSIDWFGWACWIMLFSILSILVWKNSIDKQNSLNNKKVFFILLLLSVPIGFFVSNLDPSSKINNLFDYENTIPVSLSALPWILGAGFIGVLPSVLIAGLGGLINALWRTHSIFSLLEVPFVAFTFSSLIRLRMNGRFIDIIKKPLFALILTMVLVIPLSVIISFIDGDRSISQRMDFVISNFSSTIVAKELELFIGGSAGLLCFSFYKMNNNIPQKPLKINRRTGSFNPTRPNWMVPFIIGLLSFLLIGSWIVAGNVARGILEERLESTSNAASESLPLFIETGQNLISNMDGKEYLSSNKKDITTILSRKVHEVPYFDELILINPEGELFARSGSISQGSFYLTDGEKKGLSFALKSTSTQTYSLPLDNEGKSILITFYTAIKNENGQIKRILIGRTTLDSNPFIRPTLESFKFLQDIGGQGIILDEDNRVLYNKNSSILLSKYDGEIPSAAELSAEISISGIKNYMYYKPVVGQPWSILLSVPAEYLQQLAFNISIPYIIMIILLVLGVSIFWRIYLRKLADSMTTLATRAAQISKGSIDQPHTVNNSNEVGKFEKVFEEMRSSLKVRLDELNNLLVVSQGVAANINIDEAVQPILDAFLSNDGISSRAVLTNKVLLDPDTNNLISFGVGSDTEALAYLDEQFYKLMSEQTIMLIPNTSRIRRLSFKPDGLIPGALIAIAMHHENIYFGTIWAAYRDHRNFSEQEINYLTTLAGQGALAASNSRLYAESEIGRRQLEAVLASTPEPVMVIDNNSKLRLANQAAINIPDLLTSSTPGTDIYKAITNPNLLGLINRNFEEGQSSGEVSLPQGRVFHTSISPVVANGKFIGKVCILKDISSYKALDTIKSEFVSTVSHDLRAPLALTRSYATMLKMVGELNEQQTGYVEKIVSGVDNMTKLVNNLLDLGRIEAGIDLQIEQISAYQVIENVINALKPQANQKTIQLIYEPTVNIPVVIEADPALLQQALYNLVENSIKYTMVGGKVKIELQVRKDFIIFEVADNGIGIAPLDVPHLFEKFYRIGKKEPSQTTGSSLGLAIVKSIAEHHQGSVTVESQLGKGSTFYLEIPYKQYKKYKANQP